MMHKPSFNCSSIVGVPVSGDYWVPHKLARYGASEFIAQFLQSSIYRIHPHCTDRPCMKNHHLPVFEGNVHDGRPQFFGWSQVRLRQISFHIVHRCI